MECPPSDLNLVKWIPNVFKTKTEWGKWSCFMKIQDLEACHMFGHWMALVITVDDCGWAKINGGLRGRYGRET